MAAGSSKGGATGSDRRRGLLLGARLYRGPVYSEQVGVPGWFFYLRTVTLSALVEPTNGMLNLLAGAAGVPIMGAITASRCS